MPDPTRSLVLSRRTPSLWQFGQVMPGSGGGGGGNRCRLKPGET